MLLTFFISNMYNHMYILTLKSELLGVPNFNNYFTLRIACSPLYILTQIVSNYLIVCLYFTRSCLAYVMATCNHLLLHELDVYKMHEKMYIVHLIHAFYTHVIVPIERI